jgi:hypothetical protein
MQLNRRDQGRELSLGRSLAETEGYSVEATPPLIQVALREYLIGTVDERSFLIIKSVWLTA